MAQRFTIDAIFKGTDKFSRPVARMTTRMDRFTRRVRKGMAGIGRMTKRMARGFRNATLTIGSLAVIGGYALKGLFGPAAKLEHAMAALDGVTRGALSSQGRMNEMREKALELGDRTIFTTNQVAGAMKNLARAGLSADDILGSIAPILFAAGADETDIETVSKGIISSMKSMSIATNALNTTNFTNMLAAVGAKAQTDITGLTEGFSKFGLVAKELGFGPASAAAAIATLQDKGVEFAQAGTQLKVFGSKLVRIKGEAKALFKELRIKIFDKGDIKDMPSVIEQIAQGLERASNKKKALATMSQAFGTRGMLAGLALVRGHKDPEKGFTKLLKVAQEEYNAAAGGVGAAQDIYMRRQKTTIGALKELRAAFEAFLAQVGGPGLGSIERLADTLSDWFRDTENINMVKTWVADMSSAIETHLSNIGKFWDENQRWIKGLGSFALMIGKVAYALIKLVGIAITGLGELFGFTWKIAKLIAGIIPGGGGLNDLLASFAPDGGSANTSVLGIPPDLVSSQQFGGSGRIIVENRTDGAIGIEDEFEGMSLQLAEASAGADSSFQPGRNRARGRR